MYVFLILAHLFACTESMNTYECFCDEIGYDDDGYKSHQLTHHELVCDSEENIRLSFSPGGVIYQALNECRDRLEEAYSESSCDCDCEYIEPCD